MDKKFLTIAINLAKKHQNLTNENPVVGCLIVKNGEILSFGITSKNGRPHAEINAINAVLDKEKIKDSTFYVSLEPCCHFGKTSPCVDEIIKYGAKRVVIAAIDNDFRVNGGGVEKLRNAKIQVDIIEIDEAYKINRGFFKANSSKIPFVSLKLAISLDGKIATKNYDSKWISSEKSRLFTNYLRCFYDGILIGGQTLRQDNSRLNCRINGLENQSPKRIIISRKGDFDKDLEIFQDVEKIKTYIFSLEKSSVKNVENIICQEKNNFIDLKNALEKMPEIGINSVLVEGGRKIASNLLKENLIDEIILVQNNKIIGNDGISCFDDFGFDKISEVFANFKRTKIREIDEENLVVFYQKNRHC